MGENNNYKLKLEGNPNEYFKYFLPFYKDFYVFTCQRLGIESMLLTFKFKRMKQGIGGHILPKDCMSENYAIYYNNTWKTISYFEIFSHELTHIKQAMDRRLWWQGSTTLWNNEPIKHNVAGKSNRAYNAYLRNPWEVEARKMSKDITLAYFQSDNYKNILASLTDQAQIDWINTNYKAEIMRFEEPEFAM